MRSVFYLLDVAPYGSEKAYGLLNAAVLSLTGEIVTLGLYGDGIYLALAGQDSEALGVPNLSDIIYAYPDIRVVAHEPSLIERGLMTESLLEAVELVDEDDFLSELSACEGMVLL